MTWGMQRFDGRWVVRARCVSPVVVLGFMCGVLGSIPSLEFDQVPWEPIGFDPID